MFAPRTSPQAYQLLPTAAHDHELELGGGDDDISELPSPIPVWRRAFAGVRLPLSPPPPHNTLHPGSRHPRLQSVLSALLRRLRKLSRTSLAVLGTALLFLLSLLVHLIVARIRGAGGPSPWSFVANPPPDLIITCPAPENGPLEYEDTVWLAEVTPALGNETATKGRLRKKRTVIRPPSNDLIRWQTESTFDRDTLCGISTPSTHDGFYTLSDSLLSFDDESSSRRRRSRIRRNDEQTTYEGFHLDSSFSPRSIHPIQPVTPIPASCLDPYLSLGLPCPCVSTPPPSLSPPNASTLTAELSPEELWKKRRRTGKPIDVFWTWVNGSERLHAHELKLAKEGLGMAVNTSAKLFRDHDELRYSLRSALKYLRGMSDHFHILASDMTPPETVANAGQAGLRLGQLPAWLKVPDDEDIRGSSRRQDNQGKFLPNHVFLSPPPEPGNDTGLDLSTREANTVQLSMRYHSQSFPPAMLERARGPTFNSFAIESTLGDQCGLSENFVYMNDDFFITHEVEEGDFYTPYYGPVIRFDFGLSIGPSDPSSGPPQGEWRPLESSSSMLCDRFGWRSRPYTAHAPKTFSSPLMREMGRGMWPERWEGTGGRPFRGMNPDPREGEGAERKHGGDDVHTGYLFGNFVAERWREALLWSWVVGRIGGTGTGSESTFDSPSLFSYEDEYEEEDDDDDDDDDEYDWLRRARARRDDSVDPEDRWTTALHEERAWAELARGGKVARIPPNEIDPEDQAYGDGAEDMIEVTLTRRDSLDLRLVDHNLERNPGRPQQEKERLGSAYTFSSMDGHPLTFSNPFLNGHNTLRGPPALTPYPMLWQRWWWADKFPNLPKWKPSSASRRAAERVRDARKKAHEEEYGEPESEEEEAERGKWDDYVDAPDWVHRPYNFTCQIKRKMCFARNSERAADVFRHIAFYRTECGDCIVQALVAASGTSGLAAFLPSPDRYFASRSASASTEPLPPPHLSLGSNWQSIDFSIPSALSLWASSRPPSSSSQSSTYPSSMRGISVREWTLQLLQRYRFVVADTRSQFHMLSDPKATRRALSSVDRDLSVSMICLNDDVMKGGEEVNRLLGSWFEGRWGEKAIWEKD